MKGGFAIGRYFGRTATTSISIKAPRSPAGSATCTVVHAGLFGWSLVPKNWEYPALAPATSILPPFAGSPPRYTRIPFGKQQEILIGKEGIIHVSGKGRQRSSSAAAAKR